MNITSTSRPFTDAVNELRARKKMRFVDLESGCGRARSTAWFNNLINGDVWSVSPPDVGTFQDLADLLETNEQAVREMIAEEWFGVTPSTEYSARVRDLAADLDALPEMNFHLVRMLINQLGPANIAPQSATNGGS